MRNEQPSFLGAAEERGDRGLGQQLFHGCGSPRLGAACPRVRRRGQQHGPGQGEDVPRLRRRGDLLRHHGQGGAAARQEAGPGERIPLPRGVSESQAQNGLLRCLHGSAKTISFVKMLSRLVKTLLSPGYGRLRVPRAQKCLYVTAGDGDPNGTLLSAPKLGKLCD